jgi:hypothetical protein
MKERIAVQTSLLGIANKAPSLAAEASIHEEPGAGKPHAGICAGLSGNWQSYRAQLTFDTNDRDAQFLPTVARNPLVPSQAVQLTKIPQEQLHTTFAATSSNQRGNAALPP